MEYEYSMDGPTRAMSGISMLGARGVLDGGREGRGALPLGVCQTFQPPSGVLRRAAGAVRGQLDPPLVDSTLTRC